MTYNVALNPPAQLAISFTNADVGAQIPISTGVLGTFSGGSGVTKAIPPGTVRAVNPRIKPAYSQFYSMSLERQVSSTLAAGVSYIDTRGIHNYSLTNYNRTDYGQVYENDAAKYAPSGAPNANRLNPQYTSINVRNADGDSYYNAGNAYVRGSNIFHTGMTLTANYTLSHSTDNTSSTFTDGGSQGGNTTGYFDPFNKALDHGNSDFDAKHRISVGIVYQLSDFHTTGFTRSAVGGWEVGSQFTANTGTPFTMYDCGLANTTTCARAHFTQAPNFHRIGDSIPTGTADLFEYIQFPAYSVKNAQNKSVRNSAEYSNYGDPKIGAADLPTIVNGIDTFGNMSARNAFRGPGNFSFNADVNKNIRFTERYSLQLRLEVYNVLNHANSYLNLSGANDVSQTSYITDYKNGAPLGSATPGNRQLQLAGKFIF